MGKPRAFGPPPLLARKDLGGQPRWLLHIKLKIRRELKSIQGIGIFKKRDAVLRRGSRIAISAAERGEKTHCTDIGKSYVS